MSQQDGIKTPFTSERIRIRTYAAIRVYNKRVDECQPEPAWYGIHIASLCSASVYVDSKAEQIVGDWREFHA